MPNDHFFTISNPEVEDAEKFNDYSLEGVACWVYAVPPPGSNTVPLIRMNNATTGNHFYTTSSVEAENATKSGWVIEGTACYVFNSPNPEAMPFYRFYSPSTNDHLYTLSQSEGQNAAGYHFEEIACWVFAEQAQGSVPLYRLLFQADRTPLIEELQVFGYDFFSNPQYVHTIRYMKGGAWSGFGDVAAATGGTLPTGSEDFACAGINDQFHLIVSKSGDDLYYAWRNGDGSWAEFSLLANLLKFQIPLERPACASVGGLLHFMGTDAADSKTLYHSIRFDETNWQQPGPVWEQTGAPASQAFSYAIAGVDDELHLCVIDVDQQFYHCIRRALPGSA